MHDGARTALCESESVAVHLHAGQVGRPDAWRAQSASRWAWVGVKARNRAVGAKAGCVAARCGASAQCAWLLSQL